MNEMTENEITLAIKSTGVFTNFFRTESDPIITDYIERNIFNRLFNYQMFMLTRECRFIKNQFPKNVAKRYYNSTSSILAKHPQ